MLGVEHYSVVTKDSHFLANDIIMLTKGSPYG